MKQTCGVYSITSPSGKVYVGSSLNIEKRWKRYRQLDCVKQPKLFRSLSKYGHINHSFKILIECSESELFEWEHHYANYFKTIENGLNCIIPNFKDVKGIVCKETRLKISIAGKGKITSEETKAKMSAASIGRKKTPEQIEKTRQANIGRKHTAEHIEKNRMAHIGTKRTEETKAKMREANKKARLVLDKTTGIFYYSVKEASDSININYGTLRDYMRNHRPNKTNLIYV